MMQNFSFEKTSLEGLIRINTFFVDDERGYFLKDYEKDVFIGNEIDTSLQETFYSRSKKGVIRGNHFQTKAPQEKLVRCIYGEIFDVAVDLRKASETFCKWEGFYLSEASNMELFIPEGFAHGFLVLSETAIVSYKCSSKFLPEYDGGIRWNDPELGIDWPLHRVGKIIVSTKDSKLPTLTQYIENNGGF